MAEEYLEHYGVLGMHWGIRKDGMPQGYHGNGEGRGNWDRDDTKAERKQENKRDFARSEVKTSVESSSKKTDKSSSKTTELKIQNGSKNVSNGQTFAGANSKKQMSDFTKTAIKVGIVVAATAATLAVVHVVGTKIRAINAPYNSMRDSERLNNIIKSADDLPKLATKESLEQSLKAVNPHFEEGPEYQYNCMFCSTAFDLRQRGFDVEAKPRRMGGRTNEILTWYKGAKKIPAQGVNNALTELKKFPNGARGNICMSGRFGGHSVAFQIVDGDPLFINAQGNEILDLKEIRRTFSLFEIIRTDNCEINWETIGETILSSKR